MFRNIIIAGVTALGLLAPSAISLQMENKIQAAPASGAKYFSTYAQATRFARSISGGYHTSITRSGRLYRLVYWARGSRG
jgi:hypothetical protein